MGDRKKEIIDSDYPTWAFDQWMNQLSGQTYVKARRAARRAVRTFKKYNIMRMARAAARDTFGPLRWVISING